MCVCVNEGVKWREIKGEGERKTSRRSGAAGGHRGETRETEIVLRQPHSSRFLVCVFVCVCDSYEASVSIRILPCITTELHACFYR